MHVTPNPLPPTKPSPSSIFHLSVNGNAILLLVKAKTLESSLPPFSHVLHPIYEQALLCLYLQSISRILLLLSASIICTLVQVTIIPGLNHYNSLLSGSLMHLRGHL